VSVRCGPESSVMVSAAGGVIVQGSGACSVAPSAAKAGRLAPKRVKHPATVNVPLDGAGDVDAGDEHCVAIGAGTGSVVTWGRVAGGRLGRRADTSAGSRAAADAIAARDSSKLAGRWGLETVSAGSRFAVPGVVGALAGVRVVAVACGSAHSLVLDEFGRAWAWGSNSVGQCGVAAGPADVPEPSRCVLRDSPLPPASGRRAVGASGRERPEPEFARAFAVSAGAEHSALVTADGRVWTAGRRDGGRLGAGCDAAAALTAEAARASAASLAAPVMLHACYRPQHSDLGAPAARGSGAAQDATARRWFVRVLGIPLPALGVACGGAHTLVLDVDSRVWAFGSSEFGQAGRPAPVTDADGAARAARDMAMESAPARRRRIAAENAATTPFGSRFSAVDDEGLAGVPREVRALAMRNVICGTVAAGWATSGVVDQRGRAWTWGTNVEGTLGRASASWSRHRPGLAGLPSDAAVADIALGRRHACAVAFHRPQDVPADQGAPEPAEPLWCSLVQRGVPVSTAELDRTPAVLRAEWDERVRIRLRSIRYTARVRAVADRLSRKRRGLAAGSRVARGLEAGASLTVGLTATRAPEPTAARRAILGPGGKVDEAALLLALDSDPARSRHPEAHRELGVIRSSVARAARGPPDEVFGQLSRQQRRAQVSEAGIDLYAAGVPSRDIPKHKVIASVLYLCGRLAEARRSSTLDDSLVGIHMAATVIQHELRFCLGRSRAIRHRRRRLGGLMTWRELFGECAAQAAALGARLARARAAQRHRLAGARARRTHLPLPAVDAIVLARGAKGRGSEALAVASGSDVISMLEQAEEDEMKRRRQATADDVNAARRHQRLTAEAKEAPEAGGAYVPRVAGSAASESSARLRRAAEMRDMEFEDDLSRLAQRNVWSHAEQHTLWKQRAAHARRDREREAMERVCMAKMDLESRRERKRLRKLLREEHQYAAAAAPGSG